MLFLSVKSFLISFFVPCTVETKEVEAITMDTKMDEITTTMECEVEEEEAGE